MLYTIIFTVLIGALCIRTPFAKNLLFSRARLALFYLGGSFFKFLGTDTPKLPVDPPPPQNLLVDEESPPNSATAAVAADGASSKSNSVTANDAGRKRCDLFFPAGTRVQITMVRHAESVGNVVGQVFDEIKAKGASGEKMFALLKSAMPAALCELDMLLTQQHTGCYSDWPLTRLGQTQALQVRTGIEQGVLTCFPPEFRVTKRQENDRGAQEDAFAGKERVVCVSSNLKRAIQTMQLAFNPTHATHPAQATGGCIIDSALQETCPHFNSSNPLSHRPNPQIGTIADTLGWRVNTDKANGINLAGFTRYRSYASKAVAALDSPSLAPEQKYGEDSLWRRMDSFVASIFARAEAPDLLPYCAVFSPEERKSNLSILRHGGGGDADRQHSINGSSPIDAVCMVGHGSWIRRFFTRYLPRQEDIKDEKERELALMMRTTGLSNTACVQFDLVLEADGVPRICTKSLALHRGEAKQLHLVSPAVAAGVTGRHDFATSSPQSPAAVAALAAEEAVAKEEGRGRGGR